jgi:hypothetical protein
MKGTKGKYTYILFFGKEKIRQSGKLWARQAEEKERSSSSTFRQIKGAASQPLHD